MHKGRIRGLATRGHEIAFGTFGIKSLEPGRITARQIEAARISVTRAMKREGQVWIRIFPDKPITKKPAEVRMGKGKGAPEYWVAVVKPGTIMFEATGVSARNRSGSPALSCSETSRSHEVHRSPGLSGTRGVSRWTSGSDEKSGNSSLVGRAAPGATPVRKATTAEIDVCPRRFAHRESDAHSRKPQTHCSVEHRDYGKV